MKGTDRETVLKMKDGHVEIRPVSEPLLALLSNFNLNLIKGVRSIRFPLRSEYNVLTHEHIQSTI